VARSLALHCRDRPACFADAGDRGIDAVFAPDHVDRPVDQAALGVVELCAVPRHLADNGLDHAEAVEPVILVFGRALAIDHRERIEAEARLHRELDKPAALQLDRMLEAAPVVDDDDLRAGAAQRRAHLLKQHRLARARLAADRDIVVAGLVLERRPEEGLAAPPDEQQVRVDAAEILALHGRDIGAVVDSTVLKRLRRSMSAPSPSASVIGMAASRPWICR
jgi:hypothetical protein